MLLDGLVILEAKAIPVLKIYSNNLCFFQVHAVLLLVCAVIIPVISEIPAYNRYKGPRGPPLPQHRGPHPGAYPKGKWPPPMPVRIPNRNFQSMVRPIPVQMGHASYKQPVIVPRPQQLPVQRFPQVLPSPQAPVNFPTAVWKSPANVYKPPVEAKPYLQLPLGSKHYEFITQTVKPLDIGPTIVPNTIKQVGEKGPIHTIPAPKLSPADKPANFKEENPPKATYNFKENDNIGPNSIPQALPLVHHPVSQSISFQQQVPNQYQVNEFNSDVQFGNQKPYFTPEAEGQRLNLNQLNADLASLASVVPQATSFGQPQQAILASQQSIVSPPVPGVLSTAEIMQIINSIPDQRLVDSYGQPIGQSQLPNKFMFQTTPVVVPTNQPYFQEIQIPQNNFNENFKPELHTFNYVEPRKPNNFNTQSRNTDYETQATDNVPVRTPSEAIAQSQYIQNYFVNQDNPSDNIIEEDLTNKEANKILSQFAKQGEVPQNIFFSTLPNREAAETLATLQAAGNVNSNLMKNIDKNNEMRIYVPEEDEEMETSEEKNTSSNQEIKIYETTYPDNHRSPDSTEYDDYSSSKEESNVSFGSRIKPKKDS